MKVARRSIEREFVDIYAGEKTCGGSYLMCGMKGKKKSSRIVRLLSY